MPKAYWDEPTVMAAEANTAVTINQPLWRWRMRNMVAPSDTRCLWASGLRQAYPTFSRRFVDLASD